MIFLICSYIHTGLVAAFSSASAFLSVYLNTFSIHVNAFCLSITFKYLCLIAILLLYFFHYIIIFSYSTIWLSVFLSVRLSLSNATKIVLLFCFCFLFFIKDCFQFFTILYQYRVRLQRLMIKKILSLAVGDVDICLFH